MADLGSVELEFIYGYMAVLYGSTVTAQLGERQRLCMVALSDRAQQLEFVFSTQARPTHYRVSTPTQLLDKRFAEGV